MARLSLAEDCGRRLDGEIGKGVNNMGSMKHLMFEEQEKELPKRTIRCPRCGCDSVSVAPHDRRMFLECFDCGYQRDGDIAMGRD